MATIDERLEALTHSVELLAGIHEASMTRIEKSIADTQKIVLQLADAMTRLARTVEVHEKRISKLEDK